MLVSDADLQDFMDARLPPVSEQDLQKMYVDEKKSITQIFKEVGLTRMVIFRLLQRFNIKRRSKSEAMKGRSPWSTDPIKNAEHRKHVGDGHRGIKYKISDEDKEKSAQRIIALNKLPWSDERTKKQSIAHAGEKNYRWMGGGENYRGESFQQQRRKARERDNFTCQRCGATEEELGQELDVHHIIKNRDFRGDHIASNDLNNLISYCKSCHGVVERELEKKLKSKT